MTKIVYHRNCRLCGKPFDAETATTRYGSDRCRYIALRWAQNEHRPAAVSMTKEQAIEQYGEMFDDPLRLVMHTRHAAAIRRIYDYCIAHNRSTFTIEQVEGIPTNITSQMLGYIARDHGAVYHTRHTEMNAAGTGQLTIWECKIGMEEI